MLRLGAGLGLALVAAAAAAALLAPSGAAIHQQDPYLFHETYHVAGPKTETDWPYVTTDDDEHVLCYVREHVPGLAGTWSATLYDELDVPVMHDTGAWASDPEPLRNVPVTAPVMNVVGIFYDVRYHQWTLEITAAGFSPEVDVWLEWVGSADECDHPPES